MKAWVSEVNSVSFVCLKAARGILQSDPNKWWRDSERGDWMLYYMNALLKSNRPEPISYEDEDLVGAIARYVKCPMVPRFGLLAWNSRNYCDTEALHRLADRVRLIWPDIPLAV